MNKIFLSACLFLVALLIPLRGAEKVRFVVYSDLYHDLIPSRPEALRGIVGAAEREKAEFLVDLGDLAFPLPQNRGIADILDSAAVPVCHVLGNLTVEGMESSYLPPAPDPAKLVAKPYRCSPSVESRKLKF